MHLEPYDSPTFLAQKDKYMFGLSLPELMIALGVAAAWFLVLLMFPIGVMFRLILVIPVTGVSLALLFVKISGISIPGYLTLSLVRMFRSPSYEESAESLLGGDPAWLALQEQRALGQSSRLSFLRRGKKMAGEAVTQEREAEIRAEASRQANEGAVAVERMARDAVRTLMKGR